MRALTRCTVTATSPKACLIGADGLCTVTDRALEREARQEPVADGGGQALEQVVAAHRGQLERARPRPRCS